MTCPTPALCDGKTLIALASWAPQITAMKLQIDWKLLGLKPGNATLLAPAMEGFQPATKFKPGDAIPVQPGKQVAAATGLTRWRWY